MIPSIINLAIGGMAFTRGIPWLWRLLLQWMPEGKAVPEYKRQLTANGLTGQMFAGAFLNIAAQGLLAWASFFHVMPALGLDLLDRARPVAAFDLPARIGQRGHAFNPPALIPRSPRSGLLEGCTPRSPRLPRPSRQPFGLPQGEGSGCEKA